MEYKIAIKMEALQAHALIWMRFTNVILSKKQIAQQGPTVQHRELYSVFVVTYNRKESEKEYVCVCVWLNHFALHLKLTQHCKLAVFQF